MEPSPRSVSDEWEADPERMAHGGGDGRAGDRTAPARLLHPDRAVDLALRPHRGTAGPRVTPTPTPTRSRPRPRPRPRRRSYRGGRWIPYRSGSVRRAGPI